MKKVFQNNLHGIIGTIIFHLILLIIFLSAKIEKVKKVNEQAISIDFVQQLPDIEKIIEQKKEKLAEMQPLSEQTRKNIAVNTAEKLEKQISTKDYIEEVKKELGIKNLNQQLSRDIDNGNVNVPAEEKKEDQGQQKKYMGPTNITYFLENRQKKYLPVPVYKCEGGGKVIVDIIVNQDGEVVSADISGKSTSDSPCLQEVAKRYALLTTFNMDFNAPSRQKGYISYNFIPQ